jgi:hypothetical protein
MTMRMCLCLSDSWTEGRDCCCARVEIAGGGVGVEPPAAVVIVVVAAGAVLAGTWKDRRSVKRRRCVRAERGGRRWVERRVEVRVVGE